MKRGFNTRTYIITALSVLLLLILSIGYNNTFFHANELSTDLEQDGLKGQITLEISHVVAENTPKGQALVKFGELVEKYSDYSINVEIYPNAMLYNDLNEVEALKDNKIQMIAPTFSKMTTYAKSWEVLDLPFLFTNEEQVEKVFKSDVGQDLLNQLQDPDMLALGFWQNGFKQMLAENDLLTNAEDFKGLPLRIMPSELLAKQFELLHATPLKSSFDEVFDQIEENKIKAMENTLSNIYSKGFYHKDRNITLSNHGLLGYAVIINSTFYNQLTTKQQKAIKLAMIDATNYNYKTAKKMNDTSLVKLKNEEVHFAELTSSQLADWKKAFAPLYRDYKSSENARFLKEIQSVLQQR